MLNSLNDIRDEYILSLVKPETTVFVVSGVAQENAKFRNELTEQAVNIEALTVAVDDNKSNIETLQKEIASNIENGTGNGAVQQVADGVGNGFDFTGKNPNAEKLDTSLKGVQPYGGVGQFASAFGGKSLAQGKRSHAEGTTTIAKANYSHAEGDNSVTLGADSHAEGYATVTGPNAQAGHAEGINTQALGKASHAEGQDTIAYGQDSHTEGSNTATVFKDEEGNVVAVGEAAHAEGGYTKAGGKYSHTEGYMSQAFEEAAHAEGDNTKAEGKSSHAGGTGAHAKGDYSFAHGNKVVAGYANQFVAGQFNANKEGNLFEIGNGKDANRPSNAFEVKEDGTAYAGGKRLLREGEASGGGGTKLYQHTIYGATISDKTDYFLSLIVNVGEQLTTDSIIGLLCNPSYRTMFCLSKFYRGYIIIVTAMQVGLTEVALTLYDGTSKTIDVGESARGLYTITEL